MVFGVGGKGMEAVVDSPGTVGELGRSDGSEVEGCAERLRRHDAEVEEGVEGFVGRL